MSLLVSVDEIVETSTDPRLAIASHWDRARLGEVADVLNGFAFKSSGFSPSDGMPLIRIRDVGRDSTAVRFDGPFDDRYLVRTGDFLIGMDGDFRIAGWRGGDALLNQRVSRVQVRHPEFYEPRFLLLVMPAYLEAIWQRTSSVTVKHLSSKTVLEIPLPLPPRAEQRRIVAAIEEQFSRLDAAEAQLASAASRLAVLRTQAIEDALVGGWPTAELGDIAEVVGGVTKDAKRQSDPALVEVPYLRVANVQRGFLDLSHVARIRVSAEKARALALQPGDVLFNEGGDRDKLGRGWVWSGEIEGCIHQNHVFRARVSTDFDPRFVSWHGNTFGRSWFYEKGRQTTNLASLNLTTLKRFPVPAPPLEEQSRIVAEIERRLSLVDSMADALAATQKRSAALRRAILERAFRGELVPQDPADEPAGALLERIRAERAAARPTLRHRPTSVKEASA